MADNEIKLTVETVEHVEHVKNSQINNRTSKANSSPDMACESMVPEVDYTISMKTYLVLFFMGITWGTCTLANVGPSSTYSHAVAELGGESIQAWIPNAALVPLIGLQPIWGAFADRFGKRWFIVAGGVAGLVGNAIAGSAESTEVIIGGQALNGLGSSLFLLVVPGAMEIVPAKSRSFTQGGMGIINGLMAIVGLLEAGAFVKMSLSGWRYVYYFNMTFFGISGLAILVLYRPPPTRLRRENTTGSQIKSIDYLGISFLLIGIVGTVTALTWGGNAYPWNDSRVIAFLVIGVGFLGVFSIYEIFGPDDGLIDHRFLQNRNFSVVMAVAFLDGMLLYGVNSFLPIEVSTLFTSDPIKTNVHLLPLNLLVLVGVFLSSYILGATKRYRTILVISVLLISVFCGLLALVTPSRVAMLLVSTGLIGLGIGVTTVIPVVIMSYAVPSHLIGTAVTLLASCRALGGVVGITIFTSIYTNSLSANLALEVADAAIQAGLPSTSIDEFVPAFLNGTTMNLSNSAGVTSSVVAAVTYTVKVTSAKSFRFVWIANAAIGICTTIFTLFLQPVGHRMTVHVESALEDGRSRQKQSTNI